MTISPGVTRYTTWYGNRGTSNRRVRPSWETAAPISGRAASRAVVAATSSKNSAPRPARCSSYHRTASANSSRAARRLRSARVTGRGCLVQCGVWLRPRIRATRFQRPAIWCAASISAAQACSASGSDGPSRLASSSAARSARAFTSSCKASARTASAALVILGSYAETRRPTSACSRRASGA